jgi:hypothetical protein
MVNGEIVNGKWLLVNGKWLVGNFPSGDLLWPLTFAL